MQSLKRGHSDSGRVKSNVKVFAKNFRVKPFQSYGCFVAAAEIFLHESDDCHTQRNKKYTRFSLQIQQLE